MSPTFHFPEALEYLRQGTRNLDATFRDSQAIAIQHTVETGGRLLILQKTGWGKSAVYFIATRILRKQGLGPTVIVSPLTSLMRNQLAAAKSFGLDAESITFEDKDFKETGKRIETKLKKNSLDVLFITPERLANEYFMRNTFPLFAENLALLVIDEVHCISDWGHDFRPDYRRIQFLLKSLRGSVRLLCTTATANERVVSDLANLLGPDLPVLQGPLARPSLQLQNIQLPSAAHRMAWLSDQLHTLEGSGIIYALTSRECERLAAFLRSQGHNVKAYYSGKKVNRPELEQELLNNEVKALVATTALGMGFDKPDLHFVIHYQTPSSVIGYYQQVGRAGRNLKNARGILLGGEEEDQINNYFIENAYPTPEEVDKILVALDQADEKGIIYKELEQYINLPGDKIAKTLKLLALERPSPVTKVGDYWQATSSTLTDEFWQKGEQQKQLRIHEQQEMRDYLALYSGHMEFLINSLNGTMESAIEQISLPPLSAFVSDASLTSAEQNIFHTKRTIDPLIYWPGGRQLFDQSGSISERHCHLPGYCLCHYSDPVIGELIKQNKYQDAHFDDQLVELLLETFESLPDKDQFTWVTYVPSLNRPNLVKSMAQRFAQRAGLRFASGLICDRQDESQKEMQNRLHQVRNLSNRFSTNPTEISREPVVLIDDMVDSGLTVTAASYLLRIQGIPAVLPLALANTSNA